MNVEPITLTPLSELPSEPTSYQQVTLLALTQTRKHVYGGTVPWATKQSRRAKNRVARKSRRANRRP